MLAWAASVGPMTEALAARIFDAALVREQGWRSAKALGCEEMKPTEITTSRNAHENVRGPGYFHGERDGSCRGPLPQLASVTWIFEHLDVLVTGPAGVGKSYIASALGQAACRQRKRVVYRRAPRLFDELALARADGTYPKLLGKLAKADVLILDALGLGALNDAQRHDLLEVVEDRYGRHSTVVTRQLPVPKWHEWLGNPTGADAVLDRLVHDAYELDLRGNSRRKEITRTAEKKN